jgi:hypothetical protein
VHISTKNASPWTILPTVIGIGLGLLHLATQFGNFGEEGNIVGDPIAMLSKEPSQITHNTEATLIKFGEGNKRHF